MTARSAGFEESDHGMAMREAEGVVARGHGVASGIAADPRFPHGTIAPQLPWLRRHVAKLDDLLGGPAHPGTINLRFAGLKLAVGAPEYRIAAVRWSECFPPENFYLSRAAIVVDAVVRPALLYIPDPATKPDHFQDADIVELLAAFVPGLAYGDRVTLRYSDAAIALTAA